MRLDHLQAVIIYALEQAKSSNIAVLDFGNNENACSDEDAVLAIESMLHEVNNLKANVGNCEVAIVEYELHNTMADAYYEQKDQF
jgi:hypothetical protein